MPGALFADQFTAVDQFISGVEFVQVLVAAQLRVPLNSMQHATVTARDLEEQDKWRRGTTSSAGFDCIVVLIPSFIGL
jgi:hypothetical protein